uniref:Uncharacterized protein n=1 Tax=Salix viminalis TaxID=40686 RepID=A0A6N2KSS2_SALVM
MIGLSGVMNWAGKAKHYGAFIVIISPAFGYQPSLIPHTRTLMLQSASKSREGEARFYCIIYTNSECPAHVLILFLMEPIPSAMKSYVRASYLSAFTEVILGCEIMNNEFKHAIDDISAGGKITIYLHLKKYFCGTLFTRLCFLERPKENHKLGDVCVHGKEGVSFRFAGNSFGSFPQRCYGLLGCTPWLQQAFKMQQAQG